MADENNRIPYSIGDLIEYPICLAIAPFVHSLGITPNAVTIFNMFLRLFILYFYINKKLGWHIVILLIITQLLDCLDGTLARKYDQKSKLGDILDHGSDAIFWGVMMIFTLYGTWDTKYFYIPLIGTGILFYSLYLKYFKDNAYYMNFLEMNGIIGILILYTSYYFAIKEMIIK